MGLDIISSHSFRQLFAFRLVQYLLDSLAFPPADARRGGGSHMGGQCKISRRGANFSQSFPGRRLNSIATPSQSAAGSLRAGGFGVGLAGDPGGDGGLHVRVEAQRDDGTDAGPRTAAGSFSFAAIDPPSRFGRLSSLLNR
jgi:hypothetical protein